MEPLELLVHHGWYFHYQPVGRLYVNEGGFAELANVIAVVARYDSISAGFPQ
jgi:hypothetical protein